MIQSITDLDVRAPTAETRVAMPAQLDLGQRWNMVHGGPELTLADIDMLLRAGVISDEDRPLILGDEALDTMILACISHGKIPEL